MDEDEWLACDDRPIRMLARVCSPENERKLGLLLVTCWRLAWHLLSPSDRERLAAVEEAVGPIAGGGESYPPGGGPSMRSTWRCRSGCGTSPRGRSQPAGTRRRRG